ncbi:MAG: PmeII family type II restriction endonuclease [Thaumarchaeota archaeon]|nr:PmeII family type II restriction endonuclease [Nitrososphaerota archaeon]
MSRRSTDLIVQKLREFVSTQISKLDGLQLKDLNINPYLIATTNLEKPQQIVEFQVDQFFNRAIVTAFGSVFQTIGQMFGTAAKIHDIDLLFVRDGKNYYIQLKSGPEGFTGPALRRTVERLEEIRKKDPSCVTIIAFAYGTHDRLSPIWSGELKADRILVGREFWEFVFQDENGYKILFALARKAGTLKQSTLEEGALRTLETARKDAVRRILKEWIRKYGGDASSIEKMLEDNT